LKDKTVTVIADDDGPGREAAARIRNSLRGVASGVSLWVCPEGAKDVTDLVNQGKGLRDLEPLRLGDPAIFGATDWEAWEPEDVEWLLEPYLPANRRVLLFGPEGSLKSLWALWVATQLAKRGQKVAYFNLEMPMKELSRRLRKLDPPKENFHLFRKVDFSSQGDLAAACDLLDGYALIVVDAWSAVHGNQNDNDTIARMDREWFLPLIEETGATLLLLDNVGAAMQTDGGMVEQERARGATTKGNKMDLTLLMTRPDELDNHTARIKVKKIRGEGTMTHPRLISTPEDVIDFRYVDDQGTDLGPMWPDDDAPPPEAKAKPEPEGAPESVLDRLKAARDKARLQKEEVD
jgi:KaiC/GvpD/RAD55 family RecA-like ATPase